MMVLRHWDPDDRYAGAILRTYKHWVLEVSWRQHTLGCFIIFCRRPGVLLHSELRDSEAFELKLIKYDIQMALRHRPAFRPDHFNYLELGNELKMLHVHGVPRYQGERTFFGRTWKDDQWGSFPPWTGEESPIQLVQAIRDEIGPLLTEPSVV